MSPEPSGTTDAPIGTDSARRFPFIAAVVLVGGWVVFLSVLALLAANPVTINREQILSSDAVIVGVRDSGPGNADSVHVEQVLAGRGVPTDLRLPQLSQSAAKGVSRFVIPLRRTRDSFQITPAPPALDGKRLVYPATPETLDAVRKILTTGAARPYP